MSDEPKAGPRPALSMPDGTGDHRRAQELASKATIAIAQGDRAGALLLYREAAVLERAAFAQIAPGKTRTWCLLAISAASLLYKGRQFEEAERALYLMLSRPDLPPWAFRELRELLDAVRDSQALPLGTHYGDRVLNFTLRGAAIGSGTAPIDLMVEKGGAISRYITRGVEWVGRAPIRRASSAKDEVKSLIEARVTQPTAGSYRFSVKLVEPYQLPLFEDPSRPIVTAAAVGDTLFGLARQATSDSPSATDTMRELVPDDEYRTVMLGLLRGIVPAGDQLSEVEIGYERPGGRVVSGILQHRYLTRRHTRSDQPGDPAVGAAVRRSTRAAGREGGGAWTPAGAEPRQGLVRDRFHDRQPQHHGEVADGRHHRSLGEQERGCPRAAAPRQEGGLVRLAGPGPRLGPRRGLIARGPPPVAPATRQGVGVGPGRKGSRGRCAPPRRCWSPAPRAQRVPRH